MRWFKLWVFVVVIYLSSIVMAAPSQVIIIRHADKIARHHPGIFLSPKGQVRAEKFLFYYVKKFGKPDYIFTTNPVYLEKGDSAFRAVQTIAPLENYLIQHQYPVVVNSIYHKKAYAQLAKQLLENIKYAHKKVLICWEHHLIAKMVKALKVPGTAPVWGNSDFDSVYVIKYNENGDFLSFQVLRNQYPVRVNPSWRSLLNKSIRQGVAHGENIK